MIISQSSASQKPPPKAFPLTAAITGFRYFLNASIIICRGQYLTPNSQVQVVLPNSLISAPAQKMFVSSLVITITFISSSSLNCFNASHIYFIMTMLRQFKSFGLLIEIYPIALLQYIDIFVKLFCQLFWEIRSANSSILFILQFLKILLLFLMNKQGQVPENANSNCPGVLSQSAGKKQACEGCPNQALCSSGTLQIDPAIQMIEKKFQSIKHIILVLSGKGGVGKSTVATQLALSLSQKYEVGILDVDICGPSVPTILGLVGQEVHQSASGWSPVYSGDLAVMSIGFLINNQNDAVIWRGPRKNGLIKQFLYEVNWGQLDYLIIDTPPGTSDEHLTLVQYLQCRPCDGAVVVTTPQQVALADVRKQLSFCKKTNIPILGVVENMSGFVCPNCKCQSSIFNPTSGGAQKMCKDFGCPLLAKIPLDPRIQVLLDKGESIFETDQQFQKESIVIKQYKKLTQLVVSTLQK